MMGSRPDTIPVRNHGWQVLGEFKKAAVMEFLENTIGVGEMALGRDLVDEREFVASLGQAAEGVLRALKATNLWQKAFGPVATANSR
jgi:hypothetical protein